MNRTTQPANNIKTVLAIETSCDETACAIVRKNDDGTIEVLCETTATSLQKHVETKGIVPEVAAREQLKSILPVIQHSLEKAGLTINHQPSTIDAIAVTTKPGLIGSLLVGTETARTLAYALNLPIIPVNHIEAHPYANFVSEVPGSKFQVPNSPKHEAQSFPQFPLLSWVISGGHTDLYLMKSHQEIIHLGGTVDDAAGECFDKCARVLGFDYPGGPFIDKLAQEWQAEKVAGSQDHKVAKLPRPMIQEDSYNVSFSGLKTAFVRLHKELTTQQPDNLTTQQLLSFELQAAISDVIVKKTEKALAEFQEVQSIIISGGAAANSGIRTKLQQLTINNPHLTLHFPPLKWCTDNAVMIGAYALFHSELQTEWQKVSAMPF